MSEASMIGIFNSKVTTFNEAIKENDADAISKIGAELLRIAFGECVKPNVSHSIKEIYKNQGLAVVEHIASLASRPLVSAKTVSDESGDNADPYYVPKKWFSDEVPNLNFTNIIGVQEIKDTFMVDIVAPLRPEFKGLYHKFMGDRLGCQYLLFGPPGTGKTHIVKCLAGALNCKIAVVQTSELLASVVGVAEKNIRDIFAQAAEHDRCLIFFDEIDSICSDRDSDDSRHTKSILTTLLTCMNGFVETKKKGQLRIIVASTNRPHVLDSALTRGERFETKIYIPLPALEDRKKFIEIELNSIPHASDISVTDLAYMLEGYSGADIKAIMRQAAKIALRRGVLHIMHGDASKAELEQVTMSDCVSAINKYINTITPEMLMQFEAYNRGISYEEFVKSNSRK